MAVGVASAIAIGLATLFAGTEMGIALSNISKGNGSSGSSDLSRAMDRGYERNKKIAKRILENGDVTKLTDDEIFEKNWEGKYEGDKAREQRRESKAEELKEKKDKETADTKPSKPAIPPILPIGGTGTTTETAGGNTNVTDQTQAGIESMINGNGLLEFMQAQQERQWAREDKIRQEEYARQDTAYSRAIRDAQSAGVNPNLMNITPSESSVGSVSSAELDYTVFEESMKGLLLEVEKEIEQEFEADENGKDRATKIATTLISTMLAMFVMKK